MSLPFNTHTSAAAGAAERGCSHGRTPPWRPPVYATYTRMERLPDELVAAVLQHLDVVTVYGTAAKVCTRWAAIVKTHLATAFAHEVRWCKYFAMAHAPPTQRLPRTGSGMCMARAGAVLYAGSDTGRICVWTRATQQPFATHPGGVWCLAGSAAELFSSGHDGAIRVWDTATGTHLRTLTGHAGCVFALALAKNTLYSGGSDLTIRVWSAGAMVSSTSITGVVAALAVASHRLFVGLFDDAYVWSTALTTSSARRWRRCPFGLTAWVRGSTGTAPLRCASAHAW